MARTRVGAHYATNRMYQRANRTGPDFNARDAAYRRALGITDGEPIPKAMGLVGRNYAPTETELLVM